MLRYISLKISKVLRNFNNKMSKIALIFLCVFLLSIIPQQLGLLIAREIQTNKKTIILMYFNNNEKYNHIVEKLNTIKHKKIIRLNEKDQIREFDILISDDKEFVESFNLNILGLLSLVYDKENKLNISESGRYIISKDDIFFSMKNKDNLAIKTTMIKRLLFVYSLINQD